MHFAGQEGGLRIVGPLPPPDEGSVDAFMEEARERMVSELRSLRAASGQGRAETAK
jgi:hypothetical protein